MKKKQEQDQESIKTVHSESLILSAGLTMHGQEMDKIAIRVFRKIEDVSMVWNLEELRECEERNLLSAHLASFLENFDLAEQLYLQSSQPLSALEMRRDLLQWDKALTLADRLKPYEIPFIAKEHAQQLEGNYANSLIYFEKGLTSVTEDTKDLIDHNEICTNGIARNSIRLGDVRRPKVAELSPKILSQRIHMQYAKAMEIEKKYKISADAYRTAKDYDNLVRILLDHLNNPEEAVRIVQECKSVEGAKLIAQFFLKINDQNSAIQFLVMSHCHAEAFKLAIDNDRVEVYASLLGSETSPEHHVPLAKYFEKRDKYFLAGKHYYFAGFYEQALNLLIKNGDDNDSIKIAVECVGTAQDGALTERLLKFLVGETDGVPKVVILLEQTDFKLSLDPRHLFSLYLAKKMFTQASKTALVIAREEQNTGQYRVAHGLLFGMYQELRTQSITIPAEIENNLMLLHSYLLVKNLIKRGSDMQAARMLIRVGNNISKFPCHMVEILTSAVIQCYKSNLKNSAFKFAAMLMRNEYRKSINEKYRKKIEGIVRKPEKVEEEENESPCPYCRTMLPDSQLTCINCKSNIPYCIATGQHIVPNNLTYCPNCRFPATYDVF
uniref:WD repeat-containing protein 19 n=1 Tax=Romanomermis culicivorax TaxID=13658 RepID=A0A915JBW9_ROMCU